MAEAPGKTWFELPASSLAQWLGFAVSVVGVMAIAMRAPGVKRLFPR